MSSNKNRGRRGKVLEVTGNKMRRRIERKETLGRIQRKKRR